MSLKSLNAIFVIIILFSSCTPYKNVPYFQDLKLDSVYREKITNYSPITIQPGDLLRIHVTSLNNEADAMFNYNLERPNSITNNPEERSSPDMRSQPNSVVGYTVDHDGNLHMPLVGVIKVAGHTTDETVHLLEASLQQVLTKPVVTVSIQNLKISVLGDVARPNTFNFQDEKITLSEVLSYAGDLNPTGIRNNIILIRELDGKRVYIPIDIRRKDFFNSPYYYLRNNDIIYVTPNRQRILSTENTLQGIALVISAISLAIYLNRK